MNKHLSKIMNFHNTQVDSSIINIEQVRKLVEYLLDTIENKIEGDIVELGCYVGESSKYLMKTLLETNSDKKLYVYDSFEGLPPLSKWEENTGWCEGTLKSTEEILISNFQQNNLPTPIIHKDWFKNIPEDKIPEKISFAFLDGDFYDSIYDSLIKIYDKVVDGGYIFFHDYERRDLPGVKEAIKDFLKERDLEYNVVKVVEQLGLLCKGKKIEFEEDKLDTQVTLVTGLWDLGRSELTEGWSRSFDHYLSKFEELLKVDNNLIIFGDEKTESFVWKHRDLSNTQFVRRDLSWFTSNEYFELIQSIRNNPNWYNQSGWLIDSTQAKLEYYNPLVMSKPFLLHDAKILDNFDSSHLVWVDAGITNTVHWGYFTHDKIQNKFDNIFKKLSFICFPYETTSEIHGFEINAMNRYAGDNVKYVGRGGIFGGPKEMISGFNSEYYSILMETLRSGYMGTEESLFSILLYRNPETYNYFEIDGNGLIGKFCEDVKNDRAVDKSFKKILYNHDTDKTGLYVIGFNSPNQFETLIESMIQYDSNFIDRPHKILLDNSTDLTTTPRYMELCEKFGFEHVKKDNLGICGGRQWIAEHFDVSGLDYYWFFEDDMFFYPKKGEVCKNGFNRYVDNLYNKSMSIINNQNFDFLKLNYTEFFGDNGTQWTWYNVPQNVREEFWPNYSRLPQMGTDPNAPRTKFNNIRTYQDVPFVDGEIYYSNWPQVVSREGNRKMFLETKWAHPYEQTWMSFMFQEHKKGKINGGLLLLTPTEHNRFDHYSGELRKES